VVVVVLRFDNAGRRSGAEAERSCFWLDGIGVICGCGASDFISGASEAAFGYVFCVMLLLLMLLLCVLFARSSYVLRCFGFVRLCVPIFLSCGVVAERRFFVVFHSWSMVFYGL
jgi:hypothetical protein